MNEQITYIWEFWLEECGLAGESFLSLELPSLESKQVHKIEIVIGNANTCLLCLDPDEQQPHPRPDDRLLQRPIIRRAPMHPTTAGSGDCLRATLVRLPPIVASLALRLAYGERGDRARVAVSREEE